MELQTASKSSKIVDEALNRIISTSFIYHRIGYDRRLMTFLPGGSVGQGARSSEAFWRLKQREGMLILEICSEHKVTCRLREGLDLIWRGRWIDFERMPVELLPVGSLRKSETDVGKGVNRVPESLFVVSLPRSLSTMIYHQVCRVVGLTSPAWTSDGEILNLDRYSLLTGPSENTSKKFIVRDSDSKLFYSVADFLDQTVQPLGYGYKDVVQPFLCTTWLRSHHFRTIRIKRNIADVAYSMLEKRWTYPARLYPQTADPEYALVRGLLRAERSLNLLDAVHLEFDQLINDESILEGALINLYGKKSINPGNFIDSHFENARSVILERRKSSAHRTLTDHLKAAEQEDPQDQSR